MALTEKQMTGGIKFGDWMLVPMDERNWELYHRHVGKAVGRHAGGTEPQWYRTSRYYQHNTFHLAIQYAADRELKDECHGRVMELQDALGEYERIVGEMVAALLPQAREVVA